MGVDALMPYKTAEIRCSRQRERYANDPAYRASRLAAAKKYRNPELSHMSHVRINYGVEKEDYYKQLELQDGKCALCNKPPTQTGRFKRLSVDHCHTTNRFRGLLCTHCNASLGWYENRKQLIQEYLNDDTGI